MVKIKNRPEQPQQKPPSLRRDEYRLGPVARGALIGLAIALLLIAMFPRLVVA